MLADLAHPLPVDAARGPTLGFRAAAAAAFVLLVALLVALPQGRMAPAGHMEGNEFVHDEAAMAMRGIANMTGTLATLALVASIWLAYRGTASRRAHARLGWAILAFAAIHVGLFLWEGSLRGGLPGALSILLFAAHGVTGALKQRIARAWGGAWWCYAHRASAWAAAFMLVEHVLLASWHWGFAAQMGP